MTAGRPLIRMPDGTDAWHRRHRQGELVSRSGRVLEDVAAPRVEFRKGGDDGVLKLQLAPLSSILADREAAVRREERRRICAIETKLRSVRFGPLAALKPMRTGEFVAGRAIVEGEVFYAAADLIGTLCFAAHVERAHLNGQSRAPALVKVRQIGSWLIGRFTPCTTVRNGAMFGGRDHSTALHGIRRVEAVIVHLGIAVTDDPAEMIRVLLAARWPSPRQMRRP